MNTRLTLARTVANDEYYTTRETVEKELEHYAERFKDKIIYCNADSFTAGYRGVRSEFFWYFHDNYRRLGLKGLIATGLYDDTEGIYVSYDPDKGVTTHGLTEGGGFATDECKRIQIGRAHV